MLPRDGDAKISEQQQAQKEEIERRNKEIKNDFLSRILDQQARARLNTLAMTKPDKAKAVENMLVNMAQTRGISGQITDEQLRNMLNDIASHTKKSTEVKFDRRRAAIDSDEDF
ncbi:Programmed cell death protein 5 [Taenia solium]|eukprot:TsM_000587100 transcript=TsM_000587100 gene=TsM_000587100